MRTVDQWLEEYGESHMHRTNKRLHWICVPAIVVSIIAALASLPVPEAVREYSSVLNWATFVAALAVVYYFALSPRLALGAVIAFAVMFGIVALLRQLPWPLWATSAAVFTIAWIGQFIGHALEGKRPSFFKDVQFLMIGPLWLLAFVYRRLGLRYA